jgi:hypothetical protein
VGAGLVVGRVEIEVGPGVLGRSDLVGDQVLEPVLVARVQDRDLGVHHAVRVERDGDRHAILVGQLLRSHDLPVDGELGHVGHTRFFDLIGLLGRSPRHRRHELGEEQQGQQSHRGTASPAPERSRPTTAAPQGHHSPPLECIAGQARVGPRRHISRRTYIGPVGGPSLRAVESGARDWFPAVTTLRVWPTIPPRCTITIPPKA